MTHILEFDLRRCCLLIRNDFFLNRSRILLTSASICVLLILVSIWDIIGPNFPMFYQKYYFIILFFAGIIVFNDLFKDLHHEVKGATWITMPASIFEKLLSRLLMATVILPAGISALVFFTSLISESINSLFFGSHHNVFNPFTEVIFWKTAKYFILLSPLFLGAVYFKKNALIKTFLSLGLYLVLIVFIVLFTMKSVFGLSFADFLFALDPEGKFQTFLLHVDNLGPIWSMIRLAVKFIFWWVLAPLCWITSYIRLKETEA